MRATLEAPPLSSVDNRRHAGFVSSETRATSLQERVENRLNQMSPGERADVAQSVTDHVHQRGLVIEGENGKEKGIPFLPVPVLFDREKIDRTATKIGTVHQVLSRIEDLAYTDHPIGQKIFDSVTGDMPPDERKLLLATKERLKQQKIRRRNIRYDTFHNHTTGDTKIIEGNTTNPEGIWYHHILLEAGLDFMRKIGINDPSLDQRRDSTVYSMLNMFHQEFASRNGGRGPRSVGMVYEQAGDASLVNRSELPRLGKFFEEQTNGELKVHIGTPRDVEAAHGLMLVQGKPVDVIWRNGIDLPDALNNAPGFVEAASHPDQYAVVNDVGGRVMGNKRLFGYFFVPEVQEAIGMTNEEIAIVSEVVPFTFSPSQVKALEDPRYGHMSPKDFMLKHRTNLLTKPPLGTHGDEIVFGANNHVWEKTVRDVVDSGTAIVQQYVDYKTATDNVPTIGANGELQFHPYVQDTNFHVINGRATGTTICRASSPPDGTIDVMNVAAGGGVRPSLRV